MRSVHFVVLIIGCAAIGQSRALFDWLFEYMDLERHEGEPVPLWQVHQQDDHMEADTIYQNVMKEFEELDEDDLEDKVGHLLGQIDLNADDTMTDRELAEWIFSIAQQLMVADADHQWVILKGNASVSNSSDGLKWDEFKHLVWPEGLEKNYSQEYANQEARFKLADLNGDGQLRLSEYEGFVHPELQPQLHEQAMQERMVRALDANHNGRVDFLEFVGTIHEDTEDNEYDESLRRIFSKFDKDDDDSWNVKEAVAFFMTSSKYLPFTRQLIYSIDGSQDKALPLATVVANAETFIGHDPYLIKTEL